MVTASTDLLITQWRDSPKFRALIDAWITLLTEENVAPIDRLAMMRNVRTAEGVFLDYIGQRLGVQRPYVNRDDITALFGFAPHGRPFDQGRFAALDSLEPQVPLGDHSYRQMLLARCEHDDDCTVAVMERALRHISPVVTVRDNFDMTFTVFAENHFLIMLADRQGALPRPAGVQMLFDEHSDVLASSGGWLVTSGDWQVGSGVVAI